MHPLLSAALAVSASLLASQPVRGPLDPPTNGPRQVEPGWHILTHATVHADPERTWTDADVYIKDGRIEAVVRKESSKIPLGGGYRVWDCTGLHIYPGFIDAYVEVDAPRPAKDAPGQHWSNRVTPQRSALDGPGLAPDAADNLRKLGFTAAAIAPKGPGIFRGSSAVVSLAKPSDDASADRPPVYLDAPYQSVAFDLTQIDPPPPGSPTDTVHWSGYPDSEMGAIALIRQTLIDADWQIQARAAGAKIEPNCLDALSGPHSLPLLFNTDDELEPLRAIKFANEFSRIPIILGSGLEFRRLAALSGPDKPCFILPLNFPKPPNVSSVGAAENTDLRELMTWEQAPTNPRRLDEAGLAVSLTTSKLGKGQSFSDSLKSALKHGLKPDRALAMLTVNPAAMLKVSDRLGTIEQGKVASLIVADGDLFQVWSEKDAKGDTKKPAPNAVKILDLWIDGRRHEIAKPDDKSAVGTWKAVEFDGKAAPDDPNAPTIVITDDLTVTIKVGDKSVKATNIHAERGQIDYTYENTPFGNPGVWTDRAVITGDDMVATSITPAGGIHRWKAHRTGPPEEADRGLPGKYRVTLVGGQAIPANKANEVILNVGQDNTLAVSAVGESVELESAQVSDQMVTFGVNLLPPFGNQAVVKVTGERKGDVIAGSLTYASGATNTWQAERVNETADAEQRERETIASIPEKLGYPFGPYAMDEIPAQETILFTNATLWTETGDGIIEKGWLAISGGKVTGIGSGAQPATNGKIRIIDCQGKQISPGLIDCHSHTGISRGVNEGGQTVTAEVRIADVTDPDDINWYRELAGGLTVVNSLHGSANPIGGQVQTNKIRWGVPRPDDMHFEGSKPGIKFALGENVKQTHWGDNEHGRYPNTRMGVETLYRDRFTAAKEYAADPNHRRDLELEALAEILKGDRIIHCHSYRQDEILMLCRICDEFGFKLGTFQHGLECYKVAEAVKTHCIGASIFSDWWNYKIEVQDAIPQAGPILHEQGITVSYNSDSDELARRLNVECAKAIKYSDPENPISPEEALKFMTINPAKQLMIDKWVGSLEVGKDADLVIWSGSPLSAMSRCEQTWIDGRCYFSLEKDAEARKKIASERRRIIQKILALSTPAEKKPEEPRKDEVPEGKYPKDEYYRAALRERNLDLLRRGIDPAAAECGDCGMTQTELQHR